MKLLLVINVEDDVADAYGDITVDYDLRGRPKEDGFYTESIKYVEDCALKPMPMKKASLEKWFAEGGTYLYTYNPNDYDKGWNDCVDFLEGDMQDD